jgi:hypothetical protein
MTMLLDRIQAFRERIANPNTSTEAVATDSPAKADIPSQVAKLKDIADELGCEVISCDYDLNVCAIGISVTGYQAGITLTTSVTVDGLVVACVDEAVLEGIPIAAPDVANLLANLLAEKLVQIPVLAETPVEVPSEISAEARAEMEAKANEVTEARTEQLLEIPAATDLGAEQKDGEQKDGEQQDSEKSVKAPRFGIKKS